MVGYTVTAGVDRNGDDIANVGSLDINVIASRCNTYDTCRSFNGGGWIKTAVDVNVRNVAGCFYVRIPGGMRVLPVCAGMKLGAWVCVHVPYVLRVAH